MSKASTETIKAAREFLSDPARWHKGSYSNQNHDAFCLLGALEHVSVNASSWDAEDLIVEHLPGGVEAFTTPQLRPIAAFNDDPATTHQDVLNLLDKTLADLGEL
jgi:hypothetical protein